MKAFGAVTSEVIFTSHSFTQCSGKSIESPPRAGSAPRFQFVHVVLSSWPSEKREPQVEKMRWVSPHHVCPPLPLPSAHGWDSVAVIRAQSGPPSSSTQWSSFFLLESQSLVNHSSLCVWGGYWWVWWPDWITPHVKVRTLQLRSRL